MKDQKILVTGGTGFLGNCLIKRLYRDNYVRVVARNEGNLIKLKDKYRVDIHPGDISDELVAKQACHGVDTIFHLAGFKHVGLAEKFVWENTTTNVVGSKNILEYSQHCDLVLGISTDKAAQVSGTYGASKLIMERLFTQYENLNSKTKYRVVRYGNVLYSTGSVLCKWKDAIQTGGTIKITDGNATRFFWTVDQAVDLIFDCIDNAKSSKPYCPVMKSIRMYDLLEAMVIKYGVNNTNIPVEEIGLQSGENLHEKILEDGPNSSECEKFTIEEILEMI